MSGAVQLFSSKASFPIFVQGLKITRMACSFCSTLTSFVSSVCSLSGSTLHAILGSAGWMGLKLTCDPAMVLPSFCVCLVQKGRIIYKTWVKIQFKGQRLVKFCLTG